MANSIDTYIVSEIFLFFISRYRKIYQEYFRGSLFPKCSPPSSHEEDGGLLNCFYTPLLIYAIIIAGVNIPSDSR